jgi:hypothetical protein
VSNTENILNLDDLGDNEANVGQEPNVESDSPRHAQRYEARYIAFIDILGFSELIRASNQDPDTIPAIYQALQIQASDAKALYHEDATDKSDLRIHTFSDFVVVSSAGAPEGLAALIYVSWCLKRDWLSKGFLARGGISFGQLFHQTTGGIPIVFGPAFLDAYRIEHEVADFPRIVLSKSVRQKRDEIVDSQALSGHLLSSLTKLVCGCDDGPMVIDSFSHLRKNGFALQSEEGVRSEAQQFKLHLETKMEDALDTPKHYRKVKWLVERFNHSISGTKQADLEVSIG